MKDLTQPRYLVIADTPYPNTPTIGTILILEESGVSNWLTVKHNDFVYSQMMLDKYPRLFRPLSWWEFRDEKDLPQFVKCIETPDQKIMPNDVLKIDVWISNGLGKIDGRIEVVLNTECYIPATATDYENYLNQQKP